MEGDSFLLNLCLALVVIVFVLWDGQEQIAQFARAIMDVLLQTRVVTRLYASNLCIYMRRNFSIAH
jgi:hypothetical protein